MREGNLVVGPRTNVGTKARHNGCETASKDSFNVTKNPRKTFLEAKNLAQEMKYVETCV